MNHPNPNADRIDHKSSANGLPNYRKMPSNICSNIHRQVHIFSDASVLASSMLQLSFFQSTRFSLLFPSSSLPYSHHLGQCRTLPPIILQDNVQILFSATFTFPSEFLNSGQYSHLSQTLRASNSRFQAPSLIW